MTEEWKRQKGTVVDAMHKLGFAGEVTEKSILKECGELKRHLLSYQRGQAVDLSYPLAVTVANVICGVLFNQRYSLKDQELKTLLETTQKLIELEEENTMGDWVPWLRHVWPAYRRTLQEEDNYAIIIAKIFDKKIEKRWQRMSSRKWTNPQDLTEAYLGELKKKTSITEDWSLEIVTDIFMAATDTSTATLRWAILYMALWPDIQTKVQTETDKLAGHTPHTFTLSERSKLPYTQATVMEIQRRATVSPTTLTHATTCNTTLAAYHIPKGTTVRQLSIYFKII